MALHILLRYEPDITNFPLRELNHLPRWNPTFIYNEWDLSIFEMCMRIHLQLNVDETFSKFSFGTMLIWWPCYVDVSGHSPTAYLRNGDMIGPRSTRPGPGIARAIRRCRKNFNQWQRSFQWKLCCHWLNFLRQRHVAVVIQGPAQLHILS